VLLAIDTATPFSGIALYDGRGVQVEHLWRTRDNHTVELMQYIVRACEQQGVAPSALRAVGVSLGPGSFTGLRVGLSIAKGLALALDVPLLGIPTLDVAAYAHWRQTLPVCAVLPAGRGRWCAALFRTIDGEWQRCSAYLLSDAAGVGALLERPTLVCGEFDQSLADAVQEAAPERAILASPAAATRRAGYLAELAWHRLSSGRHDDVISLSPIYLQHA